MHNLAPLTLHHCGHLRSDFLMVCPDRIANSAEIAVCHLRGLVSEQVEKDMGANP